MYQIIERWYECKYNGYMMKNFGEPEEKYEDAKQFCDYLNSLCGGKRYFVVFKKEEAS